VNIGPLFPTKTKEWHGEFPGYEGLERIARALSVPFTVMGGITREHIPELVARGVRTVAVVSAITRAADPESAARELLSLVHATKPS